MNDWREQDQELILRLGQLPRSRKPGRDLWPGIRARLDAQPAVHAASAGRTWAWPAIAASVAIAFAAGLLLGRQDKVETLAGGHGLPGGPALVAALEASEREYQAAFRTLAPVAVAPAVFGAQDIEAIERSWMELHEAETALLTALKEHPDNAYLGAKLLDLRAQQLEFMKQLRMLDQNSRRNT